MLLLKIWIILTYFLINFCAAHHKYTTYEEMYQELVETNLKFPNRTHLYSMGKSVEGKDLWVLAVANQKPNVHVPLRPEVKFVGNIHGNELPTAELMLDFIWTLTENPENETIIDHILNTTRIHVLVSMNPDGTQAADLNSCDSLFGQNNSNNFDLNMNFPDRFFCNADPIQPETQAILTWLDSIRFLLSLKFHTGGFAVTYPYENFENAQALDIAKYSPTEDDDVFVNLAKLYSLNHATMVGAECDGLVFTDGITNGASWYPPIPGGMEDVNYWKFGTYEITAEISCCRIPPPERLSEIWRENKKSLIEFTKAANTGIRGIIKYDNDVPAKYLSVQINSREPIFKTDENGEYYAIVLPGYYNMTVMFNCDPIYSTRFHIPSTTGLTVLNITLDRKYLSQAFYYRLDKYALFCTKSKAPVDCTISGKIPPPPPAPPANPSPSIDDQNSSNDSNDDTNKASSIFFNPFVILTLYCLNFAKSLLI